MDENKYNYYDDDVEIDLIDMMFYLLKKWRGLVIAIILGLVLGLGIYLLKDHQQKAELAAQKAVAENTDGTEAFDESKYDISDDAESNMELAYQYRQLYHRQLEYNQKSVIMQIDPNAVYTGELRYYLSAGYDTGLVSVLYQCILSDKELLTKLQEASGLDCEVSYIKELIDSGISNENDANININNLVADITNSVTSVTKNSFVSYNVVSTSAESCEKMIQVIREKVMELDAQCQESYAGYSAVEVTDTVQKVTDNSYLNLQKSNVDQLNNYLSNVQKLENALTDEEKEYYCKKYLSREYVAEDDEEEIASVSVASAEPVSKVKWILVGIVLGIFLWGILECCKYLFDGSVKTLSEVQELTHVPVLGCYREISDGRKGIDRLISRLQMNVTGKGDSIDYIADMIMTVMGTESLLGFSLGSGDSIKNHAFAVSLTERCEGIAESEYISGSRDALDRGRKTGEEIIVVSIGKTKREDVKRELQVCDLQHIRISGIIVEGNI